jgi:hypothetical protein
MYTSKQQKDNSVLSVYNKNIDSTLKRRFIIITSENRNADFINYHDISFMNYAKKYNYTYYRLDNCKASESTIFWCKMIKLYNFLNYYPHEFDYILWVDSDTIITDMSISLDHVVSSCHEKDIIVGVDYCHDTPLKPFIVNAGIVLIKHSAIGKQFIHECIAEVHKRPHCIMNNTEQGDWAGICYEQGTMNVLLSTRELFRSHAFFDLNSRFFFNYLPPVYSYMKKYGFILHLAGSNNSLRNAWFKSLI